MHEDLTDALVATYAQVRELVAGLSESDFARPTRTDWTVAELLFHQSLDAVRALAAFATTTDAEPDVDAVAYWRPFRPSEGDGGAGHARFVRLAASGFTGGSALRDWWGTVSIGAARAAGAADPASRVRTQGHVIAVPDFVSTLLVEATIHHLDLIVDLPSPPDVRPPTQAGLAEVRRVLEGLLGAPLPARWDDTEAALKGTGRSPLTDADRRLLGDRADAVPLLG